MARSPSSKNDSTSKQHQLTSSSPAMKSNIERKPRNAMAKSLKSANGVVTKSVGIQDVAVVLHMKANNGHPAYLGSIPVHFENNEDFMERCKVVLVTHQKDPHSDEPLAVVNKNGNSYPVEITVIATGGQCDVSKAASKYATTLTEIARNECRTDWKYGIPIFMYKGDTTGGTVHPLGHYLVSYDCVTVMKCIFEDITTKEHFLQKEDKDAILAAVFGDTMTGMSVINGIPEDVFDAL